MNRKKNIYLYGISGIYNYGCEAMVRAISGKIKSVNPLANIIYKTYNYEYDKKQLADCETVNVSQLEVHANNSSLKHKLKRGIKYIKKKAGIANESDRLPFNTEWLKECDCLVIIGGDVFDLLPGEIKGYDNERIWASKIVKNNNGKVVLWGISVGNFESNIYAKESLINYFKNIVDIAIIRDKKSLSYLQENGVTNAYLCADPAFMLKHEQTTYDSRYNVKTLGINLSPLANRYLKTKKMKKIGQ